MYAPRFLQRKAKGEMNREIGRFLVLFSNKVLNGYEKFIE